MWRSPVRVAFLCTLVIGASAAAADAQAPSFTASGSAEQIHVVGLASLARMALLSRAGRTVASAQADSLGGLIFYNVRPGSGYRVRLLPHGSKSGPITVYSESDAPWDP